MILLTASPRYTAIELVFTNLNKRYIDEMAYTGLQENHYPNPIPHPFVQQILNNLLQCHRFHDIWTSFLGWNMVESCGINVYESWCCTCVWWIYTACRTNGTTHMCGICDLEWRMSTRTFTIDLLPMHVYRVGRQYLAHGIWTCVIACRCFPQHHPLPMLPHEDACTAIDLSASSCASATAAQRFGLGVFSSQARQWKKLCTSKISSWTFNIF